MATLQTGAYPTHPPHFATYPYRTPPQTPPASGHYAYYSPRNYVFTSAPPKGHTRRATGDGLFTHTTTTNTTPRKQTHYTTPEYAYYAPAESTPQRKSDYVSGYERERQSTRHRTAASSHHHRKYSSGGRQYSSRTHYVVDGEDYAYDRSNEYLPRYEQYEQRPPPYRRQTHYYHQGSRADHYYDQVPIYTAAADSDNRQQPRPRTASYTFKETRPPQRPRPSTATNPPRKATEEDARKAHIPAGYSYKNWDPSEEPILLLGSVFDANSLGKWIYDWTVFFFGPATPMSEVAGELWLLLIQLAHKIKRAEETMGRIRAKKNYELLEEFLDSGERLWQRFSKLLKICENYMWKAAKRECGNTKNVTMGKNSGCEFVDAIFGRDRELERTEKLMTGMRLWSMRFDANCEDILRNPLA